MSHLTLEELVRSVGDPAREGELYDEMVRVRAQFCPQLLQSFAFLKGREQALDWSYQSLAIILERVLRFRSADAGDPGHGPGHWARDYAHALTLASDPELDPSVVPCCLFGGTLHDIGTLFLDRYADKDKAFRHAEAGALIVRAAAIESGALNPDQADLVAYVIASHTHYLRASQVACKDGVTRAVDPYVCESDDGKPFLEVWLPRWADRLDCNGPCMIGRHYLTLARDHDDYSQQGFYKVTFAEAMQPLLRTPDEIKAAGGRQTMLEHMRMFASSQNNQSPYGKYDRGIMVKIRDQYRGMLERIIDKVHNPIDQDENYILGAWTWFLHSNIEPSKAGRETAEQLDRNFRTLDADTRRAWASGFRMTMVEYIDWSVRMLNFMATMPKKFHSLPFVMNECEFFRPSLSWVSDPI